MLLFRCYKETARENYIICKTLTGDKGLGRILCDITFEWVFSGVSENIVRDLQPPAVFLGIKVMNAKVNAVKVS